MCSWYSEYDYMHWYFEHVLAARKSSCWQWSPHVLHRQGVSSRGSIRQWTDRCYTTWGQYFTADPWRTSPTAIWSCVSYSYSTFVRVFTIKSMWHLNCEGTEQMYSKYISVLSIYRKTHTILYTPQYFHTLIYWLSSCNRNSNFQKIRLWFGEKNRLDTKYMVRPSVTFRVRSITSYA